MTDPSPLSLRAMSDVLDERVRQTLAGEVTPGTSEFPMNRLRDLVRPVNLAAPVGFGPLRTALVKLAAGCIAWIEAIDREAERG